MKKIALTLAVLLCGSFSYAAVTDISLEPLMNKVYDSTSSALKTISSSSGVITLSRKESSQSLAEDALSYTTNFAAKTRIKQILLHSSIAITQTVTISIDSKTGANYDTTLASNSLVSESNYSYLPCPEFILESGDEIVVACTNTGTPAATVYVTILGETLS